MELTEISIADITFDDSTRQRKRLDKIEELAESIRQDGQLQPIIIDRNKKLIAGRRRLEACKHLGRTTISAAYRDTLDPLEQKRLELAENWHRSDLTWQEKSMAILELHELNGGGRGDGEMKATAESVGLDAGLVGKYIKVGAELRTGNPRVQACTSINQAAELVNRTRKLKVDTAMSQIGELDPESTLSLEALKDSPLQQVASLTPPTLWKHRIDQADFLKFAPSYSGPRFNFVHCDFPYGIGIDKSDAAGSATHETQYEDSPKLFWALTDTLIKNKARLFLDSAHLMFWFSPKYQFELIGKLKAGGFWVHEVPLIWHKSDGKGIASDHTRRPKHVYETALWCSLGDRSIFQLKNDVFAAPIARADEGHISAKPEEMLRHFFSMGVNNLTTFLDPTCGSGTSVRAALSLGAESALGLELNPDTASNAQLRLDRAIREGKAA